MGILSGKTIAITRPRSQQDSFARLIEKAGGIPLRTPLIEIFPSYDREGLKDLLLKASGFDWICFTSANGVNFVLDFAERENLVSSLRGCRFACIGPATAKALEARGIRADLIPETFQAEGLLEVLQKSGISGKHFLLLRARGAREILKEALVLHGGLVAEFPVYDTRPHPEGKDELARMLETARVNCVTFTSSSTVRSFSDLVKEKGIHLDKGGVVLASIGPVTSITLRETGLWVDVEAGASTTKGLMDALEEFFKKKVIEKVV